jgi:hypothetical protein
MLSNIHQGDLSILFVLIALFCLLGAGYCAYLSNWLGTALLVVVAVVALYVGA